MNVFDLLAIMPFYLWVAMRSLQMAKALGVLRTVRLVRLFRIFKLGRYSVGLQLMAEALKNSAQALWVLSFFLCIGILLFSSAVYYAERMGCPDYEDLLQLPHRDEKNGTEWDRYVGDCRLSKDGKHATYGLCCDEHGSPLDFPSIVAAFWWSSVSMTTVGFGEVYPRTGMGRIVATATMLSGILLIALPVAIIGRKFQEVYDKTEYEKELYGEVTAAMEYSPDTAVASMSIRSSISNPSQDGGQSTVSQVHDGPTLTEMSRRMRLMKLPDANMTALALELAEELEDADDMEKEISSMEREEKERQVVVVEQFDGLLKRLMELLDPDSEANKAKGWGSFVKNGKDLPGIGNLSPSAQRPGEKAGPQDDDKMMAKDALRADPARPEAAPPLPPPVEDPPVEPPSLEPPPAADAAKPQAAEVEHAQPPGVLDSPRRDNDGSLNQ
jgi:hypothetical protein